MEILKQAQKRNTFINDGDVVVLSLELPEGNIDGDTTFTLGLELVQHPGVLEGALAHLMGFLLELLDDTLVDAAAFVDEMAGGGRLARVDVANHHDVDVQLFFTHFYRFFWKMFLSKREDLKVTLNKLKLLNYKLPPC